MTVCPKLTIGIPVYNGEKFLQRRLESIQSQTFEDFVVFISDNNSFDNTPKICKDFMKKDYRIQYIKQTHNTKRYQKTCQVVHQSHFELSSLYIKNINASIKTIGRYVHGAESRNNEILKKAPASDKANKVNTMRLGDQPFSKSR